MNHLQNHPDIQSKIFKVKTCTYALSYSHGHWSLRKIIDGKLHNKTEITNKSDEAIFRYLADTERCTPMYAKMAYENTQMD